ncbi:MAG: hypothetical protein ACFB13_06765 [Kiloniellaceae bacterium]
MLRESQRLAVVFCFVFVLCTSGSADAQNEVKPCDQWRSATVDDTSKQALHCCEGIALKATLPVWCDLFLPKEDLDQFHFPVVPVMPSVPVMPAGDDIEELAIPPYFQS